MGSPPPRESGGGRAKVRGKYSIDSIRKNRYLVTLARVSPRRNNRSRAQTSIFAIENLMSSTRARRQEARKCRPEEFSARYEMIQFKLFFQYFCSPAPVHEGMNNSKTIHFLLIFSVFLLSCMRPRRQKKYESHSFPIFSVFLFLAQGFWDLDIGLRTLDFGLRTLNLGC